MLFERSDALTIYFKEINKLERKVTLAEEQALSIRIQNGDESAISEMIKPHLKYVITLANKYSGLGVSVDDLINEGNIAMIKAAKDYDGAMNVRFTAHAAYKIIKALNDAIGNTGRIVRLPMNVEYDIYKAKTGKLEVDPNDLEHNIDSAPIEQVIRIDIDTPIGENGDNTLGDIILINESESDIMHEQEDRLRKIHALTAKLSARDREIVLDSFGINREYPLSVELIANKWKLGETRINQIISTAISTMRTAAIS